jgi:hypothetical protein
MFKRIDSLRFWCNKILPLVYDDSLSYYETLCKIAEKLNEVINDMNNIPQYIADLINDEKLKEIMSTLFNNLQEQIASANEGVSKTATEGRTVGELVWLNGELYKITHNMIAGDQYVINSNCEKITIEEWVNNFNTLLENSINNEKEARENADNTLQNNINDEKEARENADNSLSEKIKNNVVYNPSQLVASNTNIGLKEGTYNVTSDITINAQIVIPKGALINIADGVTLTINGSITAGRYQIFIGNGNLIVNSETNPIGYPEWFGATVNDPNFDNSNAIKKCFNIFNVTELSSADYYVANTIELSTSNRILKGVNQLNWSYEELTKKGTRIITSNPTKAVILVGTYNKPDNINLSVQNVTLQDLTITRTSGSDWVSNSIGIHISQAFRCNFKRVMCFNNDLGIVIQGCTNLHVDKCNLFAEILQNSDMSRTLRNIFIDNSVNSAMNIPNVSIYVNDCIINTGGGNILTSSSGITVSSNTAPCSDLFFYENAIEWLNNGIEIIANNTSNTSNDIHICHNELDVIKGNGIILLNIGDGSNVEIIDNYIAPSSVASETFSGIRIDGANGVTIRDNSVVSKNYANSKGLYITNSSSINTSGNLLTECKTSVEVSTLSCCHFNDIITNFTNNECTAFFGASISHCIITSSIKGNSNYFTKGVYLESSSACEIDVTKFFTNSITDGTSKYVYVNDQFASNVGTINGCLITGVMA